MPISVPSEPNLAKRHRHQLDQAGKAVPDMWAFAVRFLC